MRKKQVLVVEGDAVIASTITARLEREEHFAVHVVANGTSALRSISAGVPDALLLDTSIRDVPAAEICRSIRRRERTARLPLILLGCRDEGLSLVDGLELGADDFIVKPFQADELEARLKALLRRHVHQRQDGPEAFSGRHLSANFTEVDVAVDGKAVSLTKREFELLRFLVRRRNDVLRRDEILTNVWGTHGWDERIVDSAMWKLRKKIRRAGGQIETVTGFGYRFNEPPK
ncbi:MAG TPA: response regulator transcription factor [Vicinamibacterales bacterium]|nr:response regulator transcription factor [Vicinamibacterales bacterium]